MPPSLMDFGRQPDDVFRRMDSRAETAAEDSEALHLTNDKHLKPSEDDKPEDDDLLSMWVCLVGRFPVLSYFTLFLSSVAF